MVEQDRPYCVAAGLKAGDEVFALAAILFHDVLHDGCNAIHIEREIARVLYPVPDGIRIVVSRNIAIARPAICHDQRRDQNKRSTLRGTAKESGCLLEVALC